MWLGELSEEWLGLWLGLLLLELRQEDWLPWFLKKNRRIRFLRSNQGESRCQQHISPGISSLRLWLSSQSTMIHFQQNLLQTLPLACQLTGLVMPEGTLHLFPKNQLSNFC